MYSSEFLTQIENYVSTLLNEKTPSIRRFHNLKHTVHVVEKSMELGCCVIRFAMAELITVVPVYDEERCIEPSGMQDTDPTFIK